MPPNHLTFIHPLLGENDAWSGYRVEFSPGEIPAQSLNQLFTANRLDQFDRRHPWFIPAQPGFEAQIERDSRWVVVFPSHVAPLQAESFKTLETSLRQAKRKVALLAVPEEKLPATGTWDYLLLGASHARTLPPFALIGQASRTVLIATEVTNHNDRDWVLKNSCALSTCEFLLSRSSSGNTGDTTRTKLIKLLALISEDADTPALEEIFRQEPKLAYSLLRLVNSAAIAPRSPITSFAQAINLLGRRQLQRWLQLLVYADPNDGKHPNPLLQKAAARGRLLEILAPHVNPEPMDGNLDDTAFMIGTFSLLDVLLNLSTPEILKQLPLSELVHKALAEHGGALGHLLHAIEAAEGHDLKQATRQLNELNIAPEIYLEAQLEAFSWAAKIRPPE